MILSHSSLSVSMWTSDALCLALFCKSWSWASGTSFARSNPTHLIRYNGFTNSPWKRLLLVVGFPVTAETGQQHKEGAEIETTRSAPEHSYFLMLRLQADYSISMPQGPHLENGHGMEIITASQRLERQCTQPMAPTLPSSSIPRWTLQEKAGSHKQEAQTGSQPPSISSAEAGSCFLWPWLPLQTAIPGEEFPFFRW